MLVMLTQPEIAQSFEAARVAGVRVRVIRYAREFVGRSQISDYAESTFRRGGELDVLAGVENCTEFWNCRRIGLFARETSVAGMTSGATGTVLLQVIHQPALFKYIALPLAAAVVTASLWSRSAWSRAFGYGRAIFSADAKVRIRNSDPDRAGRTATFFDKIKDRHSKPERTWMYAINVRAQLAELILHPPSTDADTREIVNYLELMRRELRRPALDLKKLDIFDWRVVIVELIYFEHSTTEQPHLIVNTRVIIPNDHGLVRPRRQILEDLSHDQGDGAPAPARYLLPLRQ